MKRLLSWLVLPVFMFVFYYLSYLFVSLLFLIGRWGYSTSTVMFWIIIILIGSGAVWLIVSVINLCAGATVMVSEKIKPSRNALRYKLAGTGGIIFSLLAIYFYAVGVIVSNLKAVFYIAMGVSTFFSLVIVLLGIAKVKERKSNAVSEM